MADNPSSNPPGNPLKRKDARPTLTLKSEAFTPEFRNLINKAAERSNKTQADWVAETLVREAQRVVKETQGGAHDNPTDNPQSTAVAMPYEETLKQVLERLDRLEARTGRVSWWPWRRGRGGDAS
jgi:uncharacterized protein (DUF1778 family)